MAIQIAEQLSANYLASLSAVAELKVGAAAEQRLAKFILEFSDKNGFKEREANSRWTHAEIAEMIGCSRETVTRLFRGFQRQNLITVNKSTIHVKRLRELQQLARV